MTGLSRKQWLIVLGTLMVAFWIALGAIERSLPEGTPGVIQYEFVGSEDRAAEMLAEWGDAGQDDIRLSLWVDYGFMLVLRRLLHPRRACDARLRQGTRAAGPGRGGPVGAVVRCRRGAIRRERERQPAADSRRPRRVHLTSLGDRVRERQVPADRDGDRLCGVGAGGAASGPARLIAVNLFNRLQPG